jgi:hypothetical protein
VKVELDVTIEPVYCRNKNCIGLRGYEYGKKPPRTIVIEDTWDLSNEVIENAMVGLISHETIEYLVHCLEEEDCVDLHELIGSGQEVSDYIGNTDGLVFKSTIFSVKQI